MNLLQQRANGASIASIKYSIANNLRNQFYGRDAGNLGLIRTFRIARKALAIAIAKAIEANDCNMAMEAINDSSARFSNTYDFFRDKFDADVVHCDHCNSLEYENNTSTVDGDGYYCDYCLDTHYHWLEAEGRHVSSDYLSDYEENGSNDPHHVIGSYHSSKRRLGKVPSAFDTRKNNIYLGLELEIEIGDGDKNERANYLLDHITTYEDGKGNSYLYALCESDGSLNHGFEMVTGWTGLDVHEKQLGFFKERFVGAKSHNTKTCGLHVHISKGNMSVLHGTKIIEFINDEQNRKLVTSLARRDESRWCAFKDKKGNTEWKKYAVKNFKNDKERLLANLNTDRYEAVNFQNPKTIEFRLFRGTLRYQTIMACLEFAYATYFFCKSTSKANLTTGAFLDFICKVDNLQDTKYLREYLEQKGFVRSNGKPLGTFKLLTQADQENLSNHDNIKALSIAEVRTLATARKVA